MIRGNVLIYHGYKYYAHNNISNFIFLKYNHVKKKKIFNANNWVTSYNRKGFPILLFRNLFFGETIVACITTCLSKTYIC